MRPSPLQNDRNLFDQIFEVKGFGEDTRTSCCLFAGAQSNPCESGNEHDFDSGLLFRGPARQLDAVETRHDDVRQQQVERRFRKLREGVKAVAHSNDFVAGAAQGSGQERAHALVIFSQKDLCHINLATAAHSPRLLLSGSSRTGNAQDVYRLRLRIRTQPKMPLLTSV